MWWVLAASAWAAPGLTTILGWTDEGLVFEGTEQMKYVPDGVWIGEAGDYAFETWEVTCLSPTRGVLRCWDQGGAHEATADVPLATPAEWAVWSKAHPVTAGSAALEVDGKAYAVRIELEGDEPTTSSEASVDVHLGYDGDGEGFVELSRGGDTWRWRFAKLQGSAMFSRTATVQPNWRPDERRLAMIVTDPGGMHMRGPVPPSVDVHHASSALVTLMNPTNLDRDTVEEAGRRLAEATGLHFQRIETAKKDRNKTTIYYREGYTDEAEAAAKAMRGGGLIEPLSWASHADLVIALGASVD